MKRPAIAAALGCAFVLAGPLLVALALGGAAMLACGATLHALGVR